MEPIKDIWEAVSSRVKSPILGSVALAFVLVNWKTLFVLFSSERTLAERFAYFDLNTDWITLYILPIIFGTAIALLSPFIRYAGAIAAEWPTRKWRDLQDASQHKRELKKTERDSEILQKQQELEQQRQDAVAAILESKRQQQEKLAEITDETLKAEAQAEITATKYPPPRDEDEREAWSLEAAVAIVLGEPVNPAHAPHIRKLEIAGDNDDLYTALKNRGADIAALYKAPEEDELSRHLKLSTLPNLTAFTQLRILDLDNTQITDLAPLATLSSLQVLWLNNTQITDLAPLATLSSLQVLWLNNTQVNDLVPLDKLSSLQTLELNNTQVNDLAPLATLSSLQVLELNNTQVNDLAPLATLSSLQELWLNNTQITDLAPLATLSSLRRLWLKNTQVTDWSPVDHVERVRGRPHDWERKTG